MCGIVGYLGDKDSVEIIMHGLKKLEYRGYDSAGVAIIHNDEIELRRSVGKLVNLENVIKEHPLTGNLGIGHTRWATHGRPSEDNAHPHKVDDIVIVHNGIIENHRQLREELEKQGCVFQSDTDTEIVAHLINRASQSGLDLLYAVQDSLKHVEGVYALLVASADDPDRLIAAKKSSPLLIGLGDSEGEYYLASDAPAILRYTRRVIYLEDMDIAQVGADGVHIFDHNGEEVTRKTVHIQWSPVAAEKGGHKHFMHKEIHEQPQSIISSLEGRVNLESGDVEFVDGGLEGINAREIKRIILVACGTAWHAAQIGRYFLETLAGIPCEVDLGSEFRYRNPIVPEGTVCIAVSQSGETADTLASLMEAKNQGAKCIAVCNVQGSTIVRSADAVCYTHAGPEIGVASTKAFVTQLSILFLLGVWLGRRNGKLKPEAAMEHLEEIARIPFRIQEILSQETKIRAIARATRNMKGYLFIGRHMNHFVALEGALKLKEISYLHAEGYAAGEMKHGPIALIDEEMLVIPIATKSHVYEKTVANIEEVRAREGRILSIVTKGDKQVPPISDYTLEIGNCPELLAPILNVVPLQLLAYHIADLRGTDVDQPRNLAKSVTVE
jgi:glutamine---fructose-6-phosphate transaminase (isomerizing)